MEVVLCLGLTVWLIVPLLTCFQGGLSSFRRSERQLVAHGILSFLAQEAAMGSGSARSGLRQVPASEVPDLADWARRSTGSTRFVETWRGLRIDRGPAGTGDSAPLSIRVTWIEGRKECSMQLEVGGPG